MGREMGMTTRIGKEKSRRETLFFKFYSNYFRLLHNKNGLSCVIKKSNVLKALLSNTFMKILFCDNSLWGLVNFRGYIINHFLGQGHEVVLVAPEKEDEQMQAEVPQGVRYIAVDMGRTASNPFTDLRYFHTLYRIYKSERPDFVFHYTIKPNIYGSVAAKRLGIKCCAMIAGLGYAFMSESLAARIARSMYRWGLRHTNHLIALNQSNYDFIISQQYCTPEKTILLKGGEGVSLSDFEFHDNSTEGATTFLFIGRLLEEKGYHEFVEAAKIVLDNHKDVKFELIGALDPSYPNSVSCETVKADEKAGIIHYLGFTNDMKSLYARHGLVVVLPSYYSEGMNRSLMEACATGKPIITTDIPGCREAVVEGVNGFIVPPKDPKALAQAIERYLKLGPGERRHMSLASRRHAEQHYDVRRVIEVYDQVVSKAKR